MDISLAKDTFFGLAPVSKKGSSFSTTLKCSKMGFFSGTPFLLISDCSEPLSLIGILADWFVDNSDNTLELNGFPDIVNAVGLDILGLVGRLTVIGLLLELSSGFVVVCIDSLGLAGGLAMIGLPPLVYFNWDNGLCRGNTLRLLLSAFLVPWWALKHGFA
jgi:hypothetical protein